MGSLTHNQSEVFTEALLTLKALVCLTIYLSKVMHTNKNLLPLLGAHMIYFPFLSSLITSPF